MNDSDERDVIQGDVEQSLASVLDRRWIVQGDERIAVQCMSVDPGDRDPLGSGGHQIYSLLQQSDGVINLIVDDGLVKVVSVGPLQHL